MPTHVQAMIFDFDGTLAHLTLDFGVMRRNALTAAHKALRKVWNGTPEAMPALPEDDGRPVLEWLELAGTCIAAHCTTTAQAIITAAHAAIEDVEVEAASRGSLFPWTRPLLADLKAQNISVGVITRNCRKAVLTVFPDMLDYCACLLAREDVPRVKPDPDHLLRALSHTGTQPQHSLMVGDHPMDIETGKAGGTLTAGVASGNASREVLVAAHPDFVAGNCLELYKALQGTYLPRTA
ncbi:HAD family hydrolase [Desulfovibrio mangrovi]|uniref:HAD family hydrolase n=1 Tax=Desulfovibrio mangrovi TaxID=2976983 RepID=UPI0022478C33|nr:HAD family hydrolase [Desulfovibrio mangrovi]UZP67846.1 HAD family hydrolase [Desulfovibrio mangrovi]